MVKNLAVIGLLSIVLSACGGGGGGSSSSGGLNEIPTSFYLSQTNVTMVPFQSVDIQMVAGQAPYQITSTNPLVAEPSKTNTTDLSFSILSKYSGAASTTTISVVDARGKKQDVQVTIATTTLAVSPTMVSVRGGSILQLAIYGGVAPYTISTDWPTQFTVPATKVGAGTYSIPVSTSVFTTQAKLIVTDATGQSTSSTVNLQATTAIVAAVQVFPTGGSAGGATLGYGSMGDPLNGTVVIQVADLYAGASRTLLLFNKTGSFTVSPTTVSTDSVGKAISYIKLNATVPGTEQAILGVQDGQTGEIFVYKFTITGQPLAITPPNYTFVGTGPNCSSGATAVTVSGGVPPYKIESRNSESVIVSPSVVAKSGFGFQVNATGRCTEAVAAVIAVTDSANNTVTMQIFNVRDVASSILNVTPNTAAITCGNCSGIQLNFSITGGKGPYTMTGAIPLLVAPTTITQTAQGPFQAALGGGYGTGSIVITDSLGQSTTAQVTVTKLAP